MTYLERKEKEKHLLYLIQHHRLKSLNKVAIDYGCSERTVKRMLFNLRVQGYKIIYCKNSHKYLFEEISEGQNLSP
ncbi:hypothetical protein [Polaribacter cellanae]|uniref:HTH domain-containing protein n=1 Tax=Polaribacter cellanae TaxID=2818493 RepID=A0A975CQV2_9FLAO|nr:hypothetical protein [Polaribacter cellanae]QTE22227.1 hypothetical protein J3359_15680 [Polaribacter cellanae]